ncbi:MAG: S-layer homology domain-containing protein [Clostridiales bacterium]|nr:S-layer homology domain-containing protein [Clostridiales bacterium]
MKTFKKVITAFIATAAVAGTFWGQVMAATPPDDPYEPNNTFDTATQVTLGKEYKAEIGSMDNYLKNKYKSDDDWYKFELTEGRTYRITVSGYTERFSETTLLINLISPDKEVSDNPFLGVSVRNDIRQRKVDNYDFEAKTSGTYYLRLHNFFDQDNKKLNNNTGYILSVNEIKSQIDFDKNVAEVPCGKSFTLKATITGKKEKITWKSSNTKVATVDKNGKVTGKMAGKTFITATLENGSIARCEVQVQYKDVTKTTDFWYKPTNYLTNLGVVKGYDNQTKFKPANECTRAQMVTFIWRLQGSPEPKAKICKFSDVKKSDYFYKAVLWGNENHIVEGYKNGTFGPQIVCARKHAVTFLWRLAGSPTKVTTKKTFSDVKKSDYFYTATLWASEKNILAGYKDGTFKPNGDCLRRQMVTFLSKYDANINGNWGKQQKVH